MVYIFLAKGFEEIEALTPLDLLRRASLEVKTVGVGGKSIVGSHGIEVQADICESDLSAADEKIDMVVLPGGIPGTPNLWASDIVKETVMRVAEKGAFVAAICAAPSLLGKMNLLSGKEATCYPGFEGELIGAVLSDKRVVRDGNIITAAGMGVALDFGLELVSALAGKDTAEKIRKAVIAD